MEYEISNMKELNEFWDNYGDNHRMDLENPDFSFKTEMNYQFFVDYSDQFLEDVKTLAGGDPNNELVRSYLLPIMVGLNPVQSFRNFKKKALNNTLKKLRIRSVCNSDNNLSCKDDEYVLEKLEKLLLS